MTQPADIVERLEDVGCDREPFTPDHAKCICRLAREAAAEITRLRAALARCLEYIEDDEITHGRTFGAGNEARAVLGKKPPAGVLDD